MYKKIIFYSSLLSFILVTNCFANSNNIEKSRTLASSITTKVANQFKKINKVTKNVLHDNKPIPAKKIIVKKGPSYRVFGRHYQTLASSKNYNEKGVASWYGRQFHRRFTSSGERYNMFKMTAAHKTLPLPTYVVVTNLRNGKQVVVKVNDRGPFVGNRIIDLSYAAAKKLGMVSRGIVRVSVKAISPHTALG